MKLDDVWLCMGAGSSIFSLICSCMVAWRYMPRYRAIESMKMGIDVGEERCIPGISCPFFFSF